MLKKQFHIVLFLLLAALPAVARYSPNTASKDPRGLYIFYDQLNEIFPSGEIVKVNKSIYESLKKQKNKPFSDAAYFILAGEFMPTLNDLSALKDFAEEGNNVFINCYSLNAEARHFFGVTDTFELIQGSDSVRLLQDAQWKMGFFRSREFEHFTNTFRPINEEEETNITILGENSVEQANFIRIRYGSGAVYIHLLPDVITNYFLLEKENYRYTQAMLSYLPRNTEQLLIKQPRYARESAGNGTYDGENENSEFSFMNVIWRNPNLRNAFLLLLLILLLMMLFGSKRLQRIIPVVQPHQNTTFEFAQTMGNLYFNKRDNRAMAEKKIKYWLEYVRNTYRISTRQIDAAFWELLQRKTGQPREVIKNIEVSLVRFRNQPHLSDRDLVHLSNSIDQFYKN